jgi:hypothetical protein
MNMPIALGFTTADGLFRYFHVFSFYSNLAGFGLIILFYWLVRRDLVKEGIAGGLILVAISIPIYWITFAVFPDWFSSYWRFQNISGVLFLGIPYEDLVWWFIIGMNLSIVYDYTHCLRLRRLAR